MSLAIKRPLPEPTQTIQEPAVPVVPLLGSASSSSARIYKRIRLTARKSAGTPPSILAYVNLLEDTQGNSNDALQVLIKISDAMLFDESEFPEAIRKLVEHFRREPESAVRVKTLSLFGDLATETVSTR